MTFTKQNIKEIQYRRWRKERGIKLVMTIKPYGVSVKTWEAKKRAVCQFEGREYVGIGETHTKALDNCFKALKEGAKLE